MKKLTLVLCMCFSFLFAYAQEEIKETNTTKQQLSGSLKSGELQNSNTMEDDEDFLSSFYVLKELDKMEKELGKAKKEDSIEFSKQEQALFKQISTQIKNKQPFEFDYETHQSELARWNRNIEANRIHGNHLAIKRTELRIFYLINKEILITSFNNAIQGLNSFKDKAYFQSLFKDTKESVKLNGIGNYKKAYKGLKWIAENSEKMSTVEKEFIENYEKVSNQVKLYLLILGKLEKNTELYREGVFILDEFSISYMVDAIDNSHPKVKNFSTGMNYYLKISLGELAVMLIVSVCFVFFRKRIVNLMSKLIQKIFVRQGDLGKEIHEYLTDTLNRPILILLYIFGVHMAMLIIVKNEVLYTESIRPWIYTGYTAMGGYIFYALINNGLNYFSDQIFKKYKGMSKELVIFSLRIMRFLLLVFIILFLLDQLGFNVKAVLASLGVGGLAVALAAKDTLGNSFAGFFMMLDKAFKLGDWIKAGDIEGVVVSAGMRSTILRTFDNAKLLVPNALLYGQAIKNYSARLVGRRIKMSIGMTYGSGMKNIVEFRRRLRELLINHEGIATDKNTILQKERKGVDTMVNKRDARGIKNTLLVYIDEYADSSINVLVYCFSKSTDWEEWLKVKEDVIIQIDRLREECECEFAFPSQSIFIEEPGQIVDTIVPQKKGDTNDK